MRTTLIRFAASAALALAGANASAQALPGQPAPAFSARDLGGRTVNLADFRGRYVVLEWNNPNCPFVKKHYDSGNMQGLQKRLTADNVAWLMVNSTAVGTEDYVDNAAKTAWLKQQGAAPSAVLLDEDGRIGRSYGARVTPHMYVIDPAGTVIYAGAIDDKRSTSAADVKTSTNYVAQALGEARAGKKVSVASTTAYGCSIKYQ
jgi:peroxiredoxin